MKLLEKLKSGFKKTIKWNKYRSQVTIQNNNNNLNYLIDPTFTNVNRLFVLSFERNDLYGWLLKIMYFKRAIKNLLWSNDRSQEESGFNIITFESSSIDILKSLTMKECKPCHQQLETDGEKKFDHPH